MPSSTVFNSTRMNTTWPTDSPTETSTASSTTTFSFSNAGVPSTSSTESTVTTVGPEIILPIILVAIAVLIVVVVSLIVFRRRQIRRKKRYAIQLAMTNRRIQAIGMLKQKAETELASLPNGTQPSQQQQKQPQQQHEQQKQRRLSAVPVGAVNTEHPTITLRNNMMSSSMSSLHSEPPYFNHMFQRANSRSAEPSRCHSANALTMASHTVEPCKVYTLEALASTKRHFPPRRGSASDASMMPKPPGVISRALRTASRFSNHRVGDAPQVRTVVAEIHACRRPVRSTTTAVSSNRTPTFVGGRGQKQPSSQSRDHRHDGVDILSISHTATHGSTSGQADSSTFDSYYPSSSTCESPGWVNVDSKKPPSDRWPTTPLASEVSNDGTVPLTYTPSHVTSQSEKWV